MKAMTGGKNPLFKSKEEMEKTLYKGTTFDEVARGGLYNDLNWSAATDEAIAARKKAYRKGHPDPPLGSQADRTGLWFGVQENKNTYYPEKQLDGIRLWWKEGGFKFGPGLEEMSTTSMTKRILTEQGQMGTRIADFKNVTGWPMVADINAEKKKAEKELTALGHENFAFVSAHGPLKRGDGYRNDLQGRMFPIDTQENTRQSLFDLHNSEISDGNKERILHNIISANATNQNLESLLEKQGGTAYLPTPHFGAVKRQLLKEAEIPGLASEVPSWSDLFKDVAGFNKGGMVDTVPAMLTPGEFVMRKSAVDAHGVDFMHKLNKTRGYNKGGLVKGYHEGGVVTGHTTEGVVAPFALDPASLSALDAVGNNMISAAGAFSESIASISAFSNGIAAFGTSFAESVQKLSQVEVGVKLAPTTVTVTFANTGFMAKLSDVLQSEITKEVIAELEKTGLDSTGSFKSDSFV